MWVRGERVALEELERSLIEVRASSVLPVRRHTRPSVASVGTSSGWLTYEPAVSDGFYLLLAPLRPGPHTIK